jgi:hypothetical protein
MLGKASKLGIGSNQSKGKVKLDPPQVKLGRIFLWIKCIFPLDKAARAMLYLRQRSKRAENCCERFAIGRGQIYFSTGHFSY